MKVAVIGAGIAGLVATKYAKENGLEVDCYEKSDKIGGTWVYSDQVGLDKHGLQIHSSMYRNLHTNLPKENMGFSDFPFTGPQNSFVTCFEVQEFLENYTNHFEIRSRIKLEHLIKNVSPLEEKWTLEAKNLISGEVSSSSYDAVFVCNGHYSVPNLPKIKGIEHFKGKTMHSHDYRVPSSFENQRILVIGAGPSGIDITHDLSTKASYVAMSHHRNRIRNYFPSNVTQKPDVVEVLEDGEVYFYDGTTETFDVILFCTGYKYTFPFLSPKCDIQVESNHVTTLFKHIVNISHPTMFFIGLTTNSLITPSFDLQVRFCYKFLTGKKSLPSKADMLADYERDLYQRQMKGLTKNKMHFLGPERCRQYYQELAETAEVEPIKPVILDIFDRVGYLRENDTKHYRKFNYQIIDDYQFREYFE